ncbi:MAG: 2-phosphosulfolactate phosphatase [Sphaerochaetaceae bacterium]|nr:2-phosphosulfolactate phosphatase [Sphaerochaetaceae bacterium]
MSEVRILGQLEGAKHAEGLTVIIDVFRAFTVECFLTSLGVKEILPVGEVSECLSLKKEHPDWYLVGERHGIKLEGFDVGNSPSQIVTGPDLSGRTVVHSTSAGVQGIVLARNATEVITGSFVNAAAVARYIKKQNPEIVSLVGMGLNGTEETAEDVLCCRYIKALVEGENPNLHRELADLRNTSGAKFFDRSKTASFPEPDFFMCLVPDIFNFVLKVDTSVNPYRINRIDI